MRGSQPGVKLGLGVPLETTLVVHRGPGILLVGPTFVELAELVGDVADLVTLRILGEDLLEKKLGAVPVVDVIW